MGEKLLTIRNLQIEGFADDTWKPIVNGIDLDLNRGEVLGLIGESGAGKSTIGIAAMGYTRPGCRIVGGSIDFDGIQILEQTPEQIREVRGVRISYVAQSAAASFNPAHRLIEQYAETPVQHGVLKFQQAANNARAIYARLELPDPDKIGNRYPHQVSGGQLQRAMVAMAMSCEPDLIVFDEPTTALDVTTQIEVLAAIKDIVKQFNTAAIYITHDLAVVVQLADRIMVLRYGDLVEESTTREILTNPKQQYTRDLLAVRTFAKNTEDAAESDVPLIEVSGLHASYAGQLKVLEDINLSVERCRTVAIVGESGSGKSTLARAITGLLPPSQGTVKYSGKLLPGSYKERSKDQLRQLQMIYQMPDVALNPRQKVRDVIGRPLGFYFGISGAERERRVKDLLEMIELPTNYVDRFTPELSGGQKQRVCIARALAADPVVIICDEVTSALDQLVAEEILKLLDRLQKELKMTYLFITHDLATVKAIADEIVVMLRGRIVEHGLKEEILTPPHHEYTELLLSSVPEMDPDWLDQILESRTTTSAA
jgi:peptide/nickel transport system ATP-binding protein